MSAPGQQRPSGRKRATSVHRLLADNLQSEYESYARKISKDGKNAGIEDPKCANHFMSAARYALTTLAGDGPAYDPERERRQNVEMQVTRRQLTENGSR